MQWMYVQQVACITVCITVQAVLATWGETAEESMLCGRSLDTLQALTVYDETQESALYDAAQDPLNLKMATSSCSSDVNTQRQKDM